MVMIDPQGGGVFLRPHKSGPVAVTLPWAFPAFAKKVIADVEIAHDEASDFEFAMALSRPDSEPDWRNDISKQVLAFSGWTRVTNRNSLNEISVELDERIKSHLSLVLAIRLPRGSDTSPANAFWRKLMLVWDE